MTNTILIDHRERNIEIIKEFEKDKIPFEITSLYNADFVISNIGIERKTKYDFLTSIIDKRLILQLKGLKEYFDRQLLILEGQENIYSIRDFHPNSIRGMISSIIMDYQIPIIYTENPRDTASFLKMIHSRFEKERVEISLINKKSFFDTSKQQEFIIQSLPGIGPNLSKALLKKFKTVKSITNADEKDLMKVDKIGKIKAKNIKNILNTIYKEDL